VPDLYVQIVPPQNLMLNGVPSNTVGVVGTANWGPVNSPGIVGSMQQFTQQFGALQARKFDLGTHVATAVQQGAASFRCVRVTDGTDTAATGTGPAGSNITFTAAFTGSLGSLITATVGPGSRTGTNSVTIGLPGLAPERFDNLSSGVYSNTVVPGTGITVVPTLTFAAPTNPLGTTATGIVNLATVGTPTIGSPGTGFVIGDTVSFTNGVVAKVLTVSSGAILTFSAQGVAGTALGSVIGAGTAIPTNPLTMISTSGVGVGPVTATFAWGLGTVTMTNNGTLYTASPTCTVQSGTGTPGTVTPIASFWGAAAAAINKGQAVQRGPSGIVTAAAGTGTTAPATATYTLSGGTDGAAGCTVATLVGTDSAVGATRTGMFALRGTGCSVGDLCDADDSTQWTTIDGFGLTEGIYMIQVLPAGTSITSAVTLKQNAGLDDYASKLMHGDWIWWNDPINGLRLISPQGFVAGRLGNLSPEQSTLNKQLYGVVGSQKSGLQGLGAVQQYSSADLQVLFIAGIDVISNPQPGGFYWGVRAGHNSSSNVAVSGDNYTRMTNYIASTLAGGMGKFVGQVINNDLLRRIRSTILSYLGNLLQQGLLATLDGTGGGNTGSIVGGVPFSVVCDVTNNPFTRTSLGYVQADIQVRYQAINEKFIVNLEGGTTVQVLRQTLPPGAA
jgi:hypothetical protein